VVEEVKKAEPELVVAKVESAEVPKLSDVPVAVVTEEAAVTDTAKAVEAVPDTAKEVAVEEAKKTEPELVVAKVELEEVPKVLEDPVIVTVEAMVATDTPKEEVAVTEELKAIVAEEEKKEGIRQILFEKIKQEIQTASVEQVNEEISPGIVAKVKEEMQVDLEKRFGRKMSGLGEHVDSLGKLSTYLNPLNIIKINNTQGWTDNDNAVFRLYIWRDMLVDLAKKKPILGFDFGKPFRSKSLEILHWGDGDWARDGWIGAHNSYLEIIYRMGIIGILLILSLLILLFKMIKQFIQCKSFTGILLCAIIINWFAAANFLLIFELPYTAIPIWTIYGLTFAYYQKKTSIPRSTQYV